MANVLLSFDEWLEVFSHCSEEDHLQLRQTCRDFNYLSTKHVKIDENNEAEAFAIHCKNRRILHVMSLIKKDVNLNYGFAGACWGGHRDIAEWMLRLGANDFNKAFSLACYSGDRSLAEWLKSMGANNLETGFKGALQSEQVDILEWLLPDITSVDFNVILGEACRDGRRQVVEWAISNGILTATGANYCEFCNNLMHKF